MAKAQRECMSILSYMYMYLSLPPIGELFAVGAFNTLRLCDKIGVGKHKAIQSRIWK